MDRFLNVEVNQIKGLLPALDRRVVKQPYIIQGRNFLLDFKGPNSGFGYSFLSNERISDFDDFMTIRIDDAVLLFTEQGVFTYDNTSERFFPQFIFASQDGEGPWTVARVGVKYYFARKSVGLIEYTPLSNSWELITSEYLPANIQACCWSAGRLVVLGSDKYVWSALEDGTNLEPSLVTGAGFQGLSIIGGDPLNLKPVANGFVVATTEGLVKAELTDTKAIFRHFQFSLLHHPINPYCMVENDSKEIIILDVKGFFSIDATKITPYQELFSEYLSKELLPTLNLTEYTRVKLFFQRERKLLFFSYSETSNPLLHNKSYVLYTPRNEWGIFNDTHMGLGEVSLSADAQFGYNFGFINPDGYFCVFNGPAYRQIPPVDVTFIYHYHSSVDFPVRNENGVWIAPCLVHVAPIDESIFVASPSGVYDFIEDAASAHITDTTHLDSYIIIGSFRWKDMQYNDELAFVTNVTIGMQESSESEDYNLIENVEEDWGALSGQEDWGSGIQNGNQYTATLLGTLDGLNTWDEQEAELEEANADGDQRFLVGVVQGLYVNLKISAEQENESYHLKSLELSGTVGGRLT